MKNMLIALVAVSTFAASAAVAGDYPEVSRPGKFSGKANPAMHEMINKVETDKTMKKGHKGKHSRKTGKTMENKKSK